MCLQSESKFLLLIIINFFFYACLACVCPTFFVMFVTLLRFSGIGKWVLICKTNLLLFLIILLSYLAFYFTIFVFYTQNSLVKVCFSAKKSYLCNELNRQYGKERYGMAI